MSGVSPLPPPSAKAATARYSVSGAAGSPSVDAIIVSSPHDTVTNDAADVVTGTTSFAAADGTRTGFLSAKPVDFCSEFSRRNDCTSSLPPVCSRVTSVLNSALVRRDGAADGTTGNGGASLDARRSSPAVTSPIWPNGAALTAAATNADGSAAAAAGAPNDRPLAAAGLKSRANSDG